MTTRATPTNERLTTLRECALKLADAISATGTRADIAAPTVAALREWAASASPRDAAAVAALAVHGTVSYMAVLLEADDGELEFREDGHAHTAFQIIAKHARALAEFAGAADALCDVPKHQE